MVIRADSHNSVSFGYLGKHLVLVSLRKTACDDYFLYPALFFQLRKFQDSVDSLLLCGFDKAAGVDDSHVRKGGVTHKVIALFV